MSRLTPRHQRMAELAQYFPNASVEELRRMVADEASDGHHGARTAPTSPAPTPAPARAGEATAIDARRLAELRQLRAAAVRLTGETETTKIIAKVQEWGRISRAPTAHALELIGHGPKGGR